MSAPSYHANVAQGSEEWHAMRCGKITASEMKHVLTPTLKIANGDKTRSHAYELAAQRITAYVEPQYVSDDMLRGHDDEFEARALYETANGKVIDCGFVTRDFGLFELGYSPDGLVGDDGLIEIKSRCQKYQIQTIAENVIADEMRSIPQDYVLQVQTGLLVTGRKWCDFISYSGGLPMVTIRVAPDAEMQEAIFEASKKFELRILEVVEAFHMAKVKHKFPDTERREYGDILG